MAFSKSKNGSWKLHQPRCEAALQRLKQSTKVDLAEVAATFSRRKRDFEKAIATPAIPRETLTLAGNEMMSKMFYFPDAHHADLGNPKIAPCTLGVR